MQLTRARISDAPVLARIHVDSWRAAYGELLPASSLDRFTHQWREESFRASLAANAEETYLIHPNAQAVGLLTLGTARDVDVDATTTKLYISSLGHRYRRGSTHWLSDLR